MAYNWRHLTDEQRAELLQRRRQSGQPWHGPPHGCELHWYHVSSACYDHSPILGVSMERLADFERSLIGTIAGSGAKLSAWCVLPNHYHMLVQCRNLRLCREAIGRMHGRTSFAWNREDGIPGRKCWHRCLPKEIKNEHHRWATMNYIHHNSVRHGYAKQWQEWPFSSAALFLDSVGRQEAERLWRQFPVLDMGANWDDAER